MKKIVSIAAMLLTAGMAMAQADDPVIMTVNGKPVQKSEFEYSYNKNNSEGVIDKKTLMDRLDTLVVEQGIPYCSIKNAYYCSPLKFGLKGQ